MLKNSWPFSTINASKSFALNFAKILDSMSSFPLLSGFQLPFLLFSIWIYLVWQCNELLSFKNIINRDHTVVKSFTNSCLYFLLAVETQPSRSLGYFSRMFSKEISNLWKANLRRLLWLFSLSTQWAIFQILALPAVYLFYNCIAKTLVKPLLHCS